MKITDILNQARTSTRVTGSSRKRVLEKISSLLADQMPGIEGDDIFDGLIERELLGSTGLGNGIAIPHCRLQHCSAVTGALFKLDEAVGFETTDDIDVDLLFVLIIPEDADDQHLQVLAELAKLFSQQQFCEALRNASNDEELFSAAIAFAAKAA